MKRNIIILAITTLILSSCGIYTKYQPETTIPEDLFGAAETVPDTVHNIANLNWRQLFVDPHLQSLIEQGLRNNTDLQSAHWRVEEAVLRLVRPAWLICPHSLFHRRAL